MADIHVPEKGSLYESLNRIEEHLDTLRTEREKLEKQVSESGQRFDEAFKLIDSSTQRWQDHEDRLRRLDDRLPKGSKVYLPHDGEKPGSAERIEIARFLLAGMSSALWGKPQIESEHFARAAAQTASPTTNPEYGGYLVPDDFMQTIIRIVGTYGRARQLCRILPVPRERMYVPTHASGPSVKWFAEGVGPTPPAGGSNEHRVVFGRLTLTLYRLMALDTLSIEVNEESIPTIADFLVDIFSETIAKEEDRVIFRGQNPANAADGNIVGVTTATNVPVVYLGNSASSGKTGFDDLVYTDLVNAFDAPNEFVSDNVTWLLSNSMANHLRKLREDKISGAEINGSGMPLFGEMVSGNPPTILGRPFIKSAVMPKYADDGVGALLLCVGDFRYYLFGDGRRLEVAFSEHAAFEDGNIVMRIMERIGGVCAKPDAFAVLKTATS